MESNELRIGNYVDCSKKRHQEKFIKVKSVTFDKINVNFREYNICDLQPIELTEEILLKFGFNTEYKKGYIGKDPEEACACDFVLSYPHRMGEWQTYFAWEFDNYKFQKLEYVHQLQNLYFALTGGELESNTI